MYSDTMIEGRNSRGAVNTSRMRADPLVGERYLRESGGCEGELNHSLWVMRMGIWVGTFLHAADASSFNMQYPGAIPRSLHWFYHSFTLIMMLLACWSFWRGWICEKVFLSGLWRILTEWSRIQFDVREAGWECKIIFGRVLEVWGGNAESNNEWGFIEESPKTGRMYMKISTGLLPLNWQNISWYIDVKNRKS